MSRTILHVPGDMGVWWSVWSCQDVIFKGLCAAVLLSDSSRSVSPAWSYCWNVPRTSCAIGCRRRWLRPSGLETAEMPCRRGWRASAATWSSLLPTTSGGNSCTRCGDVLGGEDPGGLQRRAQDHPHLGQRVIVDSVQDG